MIVGKKFPTIRAESLSGKEVTLPDDISSETALIGIAFVRKAQLMLDSWLEPFEDVCKGESIYEVPMIEGAFWKIFSGFIDGGMRAGIPEDKHDNVMTFYGNASEIRKELDMDDKSLGYVFLLDDDGIIQFSGKGYAEEKELEKMMSKIRNVCNLK